MRRIRAEIDASFRRTGEAPREIVLTSEEMADLKNDPAIRLLLPSSTASITQLCGVPIREQP